MNEIEHAFLWLIGGILAGTGIGIAFAVIAAVGRMSARGCF